MYYNTTHEQGETLKNYEVKAKTQDEKVLQFFNKGSKLSASQIYSAYAKVYDLFQLCPITSIRRSLNTLENLGKIRKTGVKITGKYGRKENTYELV